MCTLSFRFVLILLVFFFFMFVATADPKINGDNALIHTIEGSDKKARNEKKTKLMKNNNEIEPLLQEMKEKSTIELVHLKILEIKENQEGKNILEHKNETTVLEEETEKEVLDTSDNDENDENFHEHEEYAHDHILPSKLRRPPPYAIQPNDDSNTETQHNPLDYDLDFPPTDITTGVFSTCYTLKLEDIMKRCKKGVKWGTGIYIPAFNRTGEKLNDEDEVKSLYELFDLKWYEMIQQLKNETGLLVYGLIFEMDNLTSIFNELSKFEEVFDGFLVDWEYQKHACYTKVPKLNTTKEIRYFMGNQDRAECNAAFDDFVNTPYRKTKPIPPHITPVFPCFDGNEGRCYRSFVIFRNETCDSNKQRYYFNPWSAANPWFFFRDACGGKMPPHDFIQSL